MSSIDSKILIIRLHGGLGETPPSFSYLREDGGETDLDLLTIYPADPAAVLVLDALPSVIKSQILEGVQKFIIDLEDVRYTNSDGIGCLMGIRRQVSDVGGAVVLLNVPSGPRKAFRITGVDRSFTIAESIGEAISYLNGDEGEGGMAPSRT